MVDHKIDGYRIVITAARGYLQADNQIKVLEYGGHIKLNRHWPYSLYKRKIFVQKKPTTSKEGYGRENLSKFK